MHLVNLVKSGFAVFSKEFQAGRRAAMDDLVLMGDIATSPAIATDYRGIARESDALVEEAEHVGPAGYIGFRLGYFVNGKSYLSRESEEEM